MTRCQRHALSVVSADIGRALALAGGRDHGAGADAEAGGSAARPHAAEFEEFRLGPGGLPGGRDRGGRARARVQRHELRRLSQRAGGGRRRASVAEVRAGRRDATMAVPGARRRTGESLFHLFSVPGHACQPVDPDRGERDRRAACRSRCSAPASSRRSPTRRCSRSRRSGDGTATASAAGPQSSRIDGRRASRRAVRLESAARDAAGVWRGCLSQRDGDHQRPVPGRDCRRRIDERGCASAIRFRIPEDVRRSADAAARHRQLRELHAVPRAGVARRGRRVARGRESGVFGAIGCAACHVPALMTGPQRQPALPSPGRRRCSPTCCSTTSAPATASAGRGRAGGDPHAGALGNALPASAAARRIGGNGRRGDPASRTRGGSLAPELRSAQRPATLGASSLPALAVRRLRSRAPVSPTPRLGSTTGTGDRRMSRRRSNPLSAA